MTNEEFIISKRKVKFDIIWNSLIEKLPKSSQLSLKKDGCDFNSKLVNRQEQYIICRRTERNMGPKICIKKEDLEKVFIDYEGFVEETRRCQSRACDRIGEGLEVSQSEMNQLKNKISKEISFLKNEKIYSETLIKIGGGSVKLEKEISKLSLNRLQAYIKKQRARKKFSCIYFEFREYGLERIVQVILHKYKVQDVLVEKALRHFAEFCKRENVIDIYDLLLLPYYARRLVDEFGNECIQKVINSIKTFIELQTFEYTNISFDDLE